MYGRIFIIVLLFQGSLRALPARGMVSLTFMDAVQEVLQYNPDIEALWYAQKAQGYSANSELAGHLPRISLGTTFSKERGQQSVASATSLNLDQLIFSASGPLQRYQQAKKTAAIVACDKEIKKNILRFEAERAFLYAWLLQEKDSLVAAEKKAAQEEVAIQAQKKKLGQRTHSEWLADVEVYGNQELESDMYTYHAYLARKKLQFFMGNKAPLTKTTTLVWDEKKRYNLKPLHAYYEYACNHRPEIAQSQYKIEREEWNVKLARGERMPTLSAGGSTGLIVTPVAEDPVLLLGLAPEIDPNNTHDKIATNFWSIKLEFKWPIFDGLVSHYRERQAEADKIKELCAREQLIASIKHEVHEKYVLLIKDLKMLKKQKATYLKCCHEFKIAEQKRDLGMLSTVAFTRALVLWYKTQSDWLEACVNAAIAERELMYACGYPAEFAI